MSTHKVLITDGLEDTGQVILSSAAIADDRNGITPDELLELVTGYDALIVRSRTKVTAEIFRVAKRLKVVGRAGVGVDNIDLSAAKSKGVIVVNAPSSTSLAVAELAFGLMLALAREIPRADAGMKTGEWMKHELKGTELAGKTLGILGMGRIGSLVARRATAFGMDVISHDPIIPAKKIVAQGVEPVGLNDLYSRADYISLHLPLTKETRFMINAQSFKRMKPGVRLVCAARGGIIDEAALFEALAAGRVSGAALDVYEKEPPGSTKLIQHPNVITTPHIGAQTMEAQSRAAEDIADEVLAALSGGSLRWKVV